MTCQSCGIDAPTKWVLFYQNVGMFVTRQWAKVEGNLCRRCIGKYFRSYTLTTLFLGWWGLISFFVTPFILLNNIARYLMALGVAEPGIGAMNTPLASTSRSVGTHSLRFKLIYGTIVCSVMLVGVAFNSVEFFEKHAPTVNAALHSGEITDESDAQYAGTRIWEDIKALNAPTKTKNTDWAGMRSELLSREPHLNDLKVQNDKLQRRLEIERTQSLGTNDICGRLVLDELGPALKDYTKTLVAEYSIIKDTPVPSQATSALLNDLANQEEEAKQKLRAFIKHDDERGCK